MSNLKAYGAHRTEEAHRKWKKSHANHIKNTSISLRFNTNTFPKTDYENLKLLAEKMASDCYSLKPSKEVVRNFISGLSKMRGDL